MRRLLLLLLLSGCCCWILHPAEADGNVGCLFSNSLCTEKVEWCYDDFAFGKCLQLYGSVEEEDLARHELTTKELKAFEQELQRLLFLGYRWSHAYTQCILQAMLYATRNRLHYDQKVCDHLIDQDLTAALGAFEAEDQVDPNSVAFVKFTPNSPKEPSNFADEIYFPPNENDEYNFLLPADELKYESLETQSDHELPLFENLKKSHHKMINIPSKRHSNENYQGFSKIYNTPSNFREGYETRDLDPDIFLELLGKSKDSTDSIYNKNDFSLGYLPSNDEEIAYLDSLVPPYSESIDIKNPDFTNEDKNEINDWFKENILNQFKTPLENTYEQFSDPYYEFLTKNFKPDMFSQYYNTPERFRQGYETKDDIDEHNEMVESRIYIDEDEPNYYKEEIGSGEQDGRFRKFKYLTNDFTNNDYSMFEKNTNNHPEYNMENQNILLAKILNDFKSNELEKKDQQKGGVYTEGGLIYASDSSIPKEFNEKSSPKLKDLLSDEWRFLRRERLDVKKPGPQFDKNQHFKHLLDNYTQYIKINNSELPPIVKKELQDDIHSNKIHENYDVDNSYAYVGFKDSLRTWKEGAHIVRTISDLLHLEPSAFSYPRVDRNEVTFRVEPNSKSLNASEIAKMIDDIKEQLKNELGVEVTSAGVGDKAKLPAVLHLSSSRLWNLPDWGEKKTLQLAVVLAGIAAMVSSGIVLTIAHFYYRRRNKLAHLSTGESEPSQDYQDLCRARMAGKWQIQTSAPEKSTNEKQEPSGQRITSLSKESDNNSPSTRSSTSSWSEEPALTNMDISTGHMVLTYMEDHLKNKDRLEQEWQALCAYEAEPNATIIAEKLENIGKNRNPEVLPYDHSRLVLNDITNLNSSDYINASTITDHDPRNPAYIAAQGPLPHTAPDFWQMIWEQGSVVMVMLTRLTENGISMCHRYWPEEGSDLYHIYEVHLVSEHIWCDDYLVRSFYLKNLKTGETRTVTQFHFLSWPDRGIPSSTKALLEFRRKVNKSYRGRSCPIVVHCSDGASRTGTYCLIDMVLNRMAKGAKEIDIAATLEHIRDQRPCMVTSKQQFEFVLMAVAEEVHAILKALPAQLQQQHDKKEKEAGEKEK